MVKPRKSCREKLIEEIGYTCRVRMSNVKNNTANRMDRQIVGECQGFLCLLNYSVLSDKEVWELWENSNLRFI